MDGRAGAGEADGVPFRGGVQVTAAEKRVAGSVGAGAWKRGGAARAQSCAYGSDEGFMTFGSCVCPTFGSRLPL